jgi:diacylglycerol kinase (ATP)
VVDGGGKTSRNDYNRIIETVFFKIMKALFLINQKSRRGKAIRPKAKKILERMGVELVEESIDRPQSIPNIVREYSDRVDLAIIGGGDGTLSTAVPGLLDTNLPLGILPLGTANNLARNLGISSSLEAACRTIYRGNIQKIDLGVVNGHYFFNVAGIGLSAAINRHVKSDLKRRWGVLAYITTGFQVFKRAIPVEARICCHSQTLEVKAKQITVCNGRYYGSGLVVAEDATIDDARLDLYGFTIDNWWEGLRLLPDMFRGRYRWKSNIFTTGGQEISIETSEICYVDVDGEVVTTTPANFYVIPQALSVIC